MLLLTVHSEKTNPYLQIFIFPFEADTPSHLCRELEKRIYRRHGVREHPQVLVTSFTGWRWQMTLTMRGSNRDKTLEAQDNKVGFRLKGQGTIHQGDDIDHWKPKT